MLCLSDEACISEPQQLMKLFDQNIQSLLSKKGVCIVSNHSN